MDTPFWNQVSRAAEREAQKLGVSLEVWGNYGSHQEDFLTNLEVAIQSKVDGIIVQGLDSDKFKELTKVKASFYGIPIMTIANDVPIEESFRRTYVGSDQHKAGELLAKQLISDMGDTGDVVLVFNKNVEHYQEQRIAGIEEVLQVYTGINLHYAKTSNAREDMVATIQDTLNQFPNADAFIAVNANSVGAIVQEISKRYQVEPFYIYSFDEGPESISLLKQGVIDAVIKQSPEEMGRKSIDLLAKWLNGNLVPLNTEGYVTDIQVLKAVDLHE